MTLPAAIVIVFGYTSSSLALAGNVLLLISTDHRSKKSAENIGFRHLLLSFLVGNTDIEYNFRHSVEISVFCVKSKFEGFSSCKIAAFCN